MPIEWVGSLSQILLEIGDYYYTLFKILIMELDLQSMQCGIRSDFLSPNSYKITLEFA